MQTHAEKQSPPRTEAPKSSDSGLPFNDRRPETATLNRLQVLADAGPQVSQLRAYQAMADASPRTANSARYSAMQEAPVLRVASEPGIQLKAGVRINDDAELEREADFMGAAALQRGAAASQALAGAAPALRQSAPAQRQGSEEDEPLQGQFAPAQRAEVDDEDVQLKAADAQQAPLQHAEAAPRPNNTGLPDNLKDGIEALSGLSLDNVKVHYNSDKPAQLNAYAYAQGTDIHVGPGQEKHLPHEAWHVVQQARGRVKRTTQAFTGERTDNTGKLEYSHDMKSDTATVQLSTLGILQLAPIIEDSTVKQKAKDKLNKHQTRLKSFIDSPRTDSLLKNSIEWFKNGHLTLYAATPTHDSKSRAENKDEKDKVAWFGYPLSPVTPEQKIELYYFPYESDKDRDENVLYQKENTRGYNDNKQGIVIMDPADRSDNELADTVIHEVQHSADRHKQKIEKKRYEAGSLGESIERYKSEFRAYSLQRNIESTENKFSRTINGLISWIKGDTSDAFPSRKEYEWPDSQWKIFKHIYDNYEYVKSAWDKENTEKPEDKSFQEKVKKFSNFRSPNPNNSWTLDCVYTKFHKLTRVKFEDNELVKELVEYIDSTLSKEDADAFLNSEDFSKSKYEMEHHPRLAVEISASIKAGLPPPPFPPEEAIEVRKFEEELCSRLWGQNKKDFDKIKSMAEKLKSEHAGYVLTNPTWEKILEATAKGNDDRYNDTTNKELESFLKKIAARQNDQQQNQ